MKFRGSRGDDIATVWRVRGLALTLPSLAREGEGKRDAYRGAHPGEWGRKRNTDRCAHSPASGRGEEVRIAAFALPRAGLGKKSADRHAHSRAGGSGERLVRCYTVLVSS